MQHIFHYNKVSFGCSSTSSITLSNIFYKNIFRTFGRISKPTAIIFLQITLTILFPFVTEKTCRAKHSGNKFKTSNHLSINHAQQIQSFKPISRTPSIKSMTCARLLSNLKIKSRQKIISSRQLNKIWIIKKRQMNRYKSK